MEGFRSFIPPHFFETENSQTIRLITAKQIEWVRVRIMYEDQYIMGYKKNQRKMFWFLPICIVNNNLGKSQEKNNSQGN